MRGRFGCMPRNNIVILIFGDSLSSKFETIVSFHASLAFTGLDTRYAPKHGFVNKLPLADSTGHFIVI